MGNKHFFSESENELIMKIGQEYYGIDNLHKDEIIECKAQSLDENLIYTNKIHNMGGEKLNKIY